MRGDRKGRDWTEIGLDEDKNGMRSEMDGWMDAIKMVYGYEVGWR